MLWQVTSAVLTFLVLVAGSVIILLSRRAEMARDADRRNVTALRDLVGTRDVQLADKTHDLEVLAAEHKQLIQVNVREMMAAWQINQSSNAFIENGKLRLEVQEFKARLSQYETL